ncbi:hypothetical protein [Chondrinema litorale]|uniref:hypothetical protein n=1 Tax=Chondrinema litorale TaxID=2994555 RepID=UPI002542D8BF|nr:hypothetical protein [Chondrinema litorale]UZR93578.1 hypothetical protein OQ292_17135 [Chondrinema litorale]
MKKLTTLVVLLFCSLFLYGQDKSSTPEEIFGHLIGSDMEEHPGFKKEYSYGFVDLGLVNIGEKQQLFGVSLEPEVGYAFYKGKLCSISFEFKNADAFDELSKMFGKPRYADTGNQALGELYSFVWEGEKIAISYPVFNYGSQGSQFITIEDKKVSQQNF